MEKTFILKDFMESIPGGMLDQTLNMTPGVNIIWGGMKNAINGSKNMRILRGIEFFETISIYPEFLKELEESEQALDGLAISFEAYTKERNKNKREIIKNIFLGFNELSEKEKEEFELEKLLDILNKITEKDIFYIKNIEKGKSNQLVFEKEKHIMKYLESLGLIIIKQEIEIYNEKFEATSYKEVESNGEITSETEITEYLNITPLFKSFIKYITN